MDSLYPILKQYGKVHSNAILAKYTTMQIGGPAQYLVEITETAKLVDLLVFLTGEGINYFILGGGSNLLLPDDGMEGVVIKIATSKVVVAGDAIVAEAGVPLAKVVNLASQNGLTGLEWGAGIPGTVGGAVRGNAGAMGKDISNNIEKVEVWRDGEVVTLDKNECGFAYRTSIFKREGGVALKAWIKLAKGDPKKIAEEVGGYILDRKGKFPAYPSAGSFFKNLKMAEWPGEKSVLPELFLQRGTVPVGYLVDQLGLRGFSVGGAKVSDEHGNFIINYKKGTQNDVLAVVDKVKTEVYNKYGVELESEVEIIK